MGYVYIPQYILENKDIKIFTYYNILLGQFKNPHLGFGSIFAGSYGNCH